MKGSFLYQGSSTIYNMLLLYSYNLCDSFLFINHNNTIHKKSVFYSETTNDDARLTYIFSQGCRRRRDPSVTKKDLKVIQKCNFNFLAPDAKLATGPPASHVPFILLVFSYVSEVPLCPLRHQGWVRRLPLTPQSSWYYKYHGSWGLRHTFSFRLQELHLFSLHNSSKGIYKH